MLEDEMAGFSKEDWKRLEKEDREFETAKGRKAKGQYTKQ